MAAITLEPSATLPANAQTTAHEVCAQTLFGWPSATSPHASAAAVVEVIGVPSDAGNGIASGARLGPAAIRQASLGLPAPNIVGIDCGDVDAVRDRDWTDALVALQTRIETITARGKLPFVLGGDHAISYAAVAALHHVGPLSVVWFDAHTDFCNWAGGDWHSHKQVLRRIAGLAHVERMVQIGHRGITYDDESTRSERLQVTTANAASTLDLDRLLAQLPAHQPVYLSVDIDAIDPRWAPGTGHPVPGGLSVALLGALAHGIAAHRDVVGIDMMEVNPLLDHRDMTSVAAATLLARIAAGIAVRRHAVGAAPAQPFIRQ